MLAGSNGPRLSLIYVAKNKIILTQGRPIIAGLVFEAAFLSGPFIHDHKDKVRHLIPQVFVKCNTDLQSFNPFPRGSQMLFC
jgi:hypothetical protein